MRRLPSPSVESPPTLLAANRLVRARGLAHVARTIRGHDGGFSLEGREWISSLLLVFDLQTRRGVGVSFSLWFTPLISSLCFSGVLGLSPRTLGTNLYGLQLWDAARVLEGLDSIFGGESPHQQYQLTVGCHLDWGWIDSLNVCGSRATS